MSGAPRCSECAYGVNTPTANYLTEIGDSLAILRLQRDVEITPRKNNLIGLLKSGCTNCVVSTADKPQIWEANEHRRIRAPNGKKIQEENAPPLVLRRPT